MEKVKAGLRGMSATDKVVHAGIIIDQMTGNPDFPMAAGLLTELVAARQELAEANSAALDRGRIACTRKRTAVQRIDPIFSKLANLVNSVAAGNVMMLVSSGFPLAKQPVPISSLGSPRAISFKQLGFPNMLKAVWNNVPGAVMYRLESSSSTGPEKEWREQATTTRPEAVVPSFADGNPLWFRVCAIGSQTTSAFTNATRAAA